LKTNGGKYDSYSFVFVVREQDENLIDILRGRRGPILKKIDPLPPFFVERGVITHSLSSKFLCVSPDKNNYFLDEKAGFRLKNNNNNRSAT
jgi:hypothetical protein